MIRDPRTTDRLRRFIQQIRSATQEHKLQWERQLGSAHRYARLNDNLLILGPATPLSESTVPRYLFITPFNSPDFIEINSNDADLGEAVSALAKEVEAVTKTAAATDPFAINIDFLDPH